MNVSDGVRIKVNDYLLAKNYISKDEHSKLVIKDNKVWDDSDYIVDVTEYGTAFIHNRGSYPMTVDVIRLFLNNQYED